MRFRNSICSLLALLVLASCSISKKNNPSAAQFDSQGHRGARGLMPENTIQGMHHTIDLGTKTLEMDLQISKDKKVVVSHDSYMGFKFCTTPEGKEMSSKDGYSRLLYNMPYDSIRKYDVGLKPHPDFPKQKKMATYKPLLSELIDSTEAYAKLKKRPIYYNMEIKTSPEYKGKGHPPVNEFVDLAMKVILDKGIKNRTMIQSFDVNALKIIHARYPGVKTSFLVFKSNTKSIKDHIASLGFTPDIFSPQYDMVTPELIKACHDEKIKVIPWTVNDLDSIKKLKDMGVDGMISDYPNLFNLAK